MTTKDIILRAEQYANKENADFYSYAEKVAMLNESWFSLYQYLCNTGDKYWIKKQIFTGKKIQLPKDCYQISAVYRKSFNDKQIYNYELEGNTLVVKASGIVNDTFILEYYPAPATLAFRDDIKKCPYQFKTEVDINDGKVLIAGTSTYSIYDTSTKNTYTTSLPIGSYAHIYNDGTVVVFNSNNSFSTYNPEIGTVRNYTTLIIYNNSVFYLEAGNIYDIKGNLVKAATLNAGIYITEDFDDFKLIPNCAAPINGRTYITYNTRTGVTDGQKVYTRYKIVGYYDNAFLTLDTLTNVLYIESIYNDTVINYPNNIFFTYLAVDIALKMRSKQGIDNAQLDSQFSMAKTALFNSIEKNKGNHVTIKDVYTDYETGGIYY